MTLKTSNALDIKTSRRPPGRPKNFNTEAVLDKALELFWQHGYTTTTTRELESGLGLKQSSIYNAFGSKRGLLDAALDRYEALTDKTLLLPLEQSNEGLAAIEAFFIALYHWVTHKGRRGCMLINMMAEDGGETEAISKRTRKYRKRVRTAFRNALLQSSAEGEITDDAIESRADLLVSLALGLNIAARGGLSNTELEKMLDASCNQIRSWQVAPI